MKIRSKITFNIFTLVALLASLLGSAVFVPSVQASQDNSLTFAGGTSLYVATSGSDSNDCLTISTPCQTINAAIGKAAVVGTRSWQLPDQLGHYLSGRQCPPQEWLVIEQRSKH